jgi:hypothetical protein
VSFNVGDRVVLVQDYYNVDPYFAAKGDIAEVVEISPAHGVGNGNVKIKWITGNGRNSTYTGNWDVSNFALGASVNAFTCYKCASAQHFVERWTATNHTVINGIDADTGKIDWGENVLGDDVTRLYFECVNCGTKYKKSDFDPVARIAAAVTDLDDLLDDGDE